MTWEKPSTDEVVKGIEPGWAKEHYVAWQKLRAQVDNIYTCLRSLDEILADALHKSD
jgi:hypothetical protein